MSMRIVSIWTPEKVSQLINLYETHECLWNYHTNEYKNRMKRDAAIRNICNTLNINKDQFAKKIHNIRNQYNFELKKLKKRGLNGGDTFIKWEYFDRLRFLKKFITNRAGYGIRKRPISPISPTHSETTNIESEVCLNSMIKKINESSSDTTQDDEQNEEYEEKRQQKHTNSIVENENHYVDHVDPIPSKASNVSYPKNVHTTTQNSAAVKKPRLSCKDNTQMRDENNTFGEFIANELRNLNSDLLRKKMKRKIMQAVLEVWNEDEEVNINICLN